MTDTNKTVGVTHKFLTFLAIVTPLGYLIGDNFFKGTLKGFGANTGVFNQSIQETYISAFWAVAYGLVAITESTIKILNMLFSAENIWPTLIVFLSATTIVYIILCRKSWLTYQHKRAICSILIQVRKLHWKNNNVTKALGITTGTTYIAMLIPSLIVIISTVFILLPLAAHSKGQSLSSDRIDEYFKHGCAATAESKWSKCMELKSADGKILVKGLLVAQSSNQVALYNKSGTVITSIPKDGSLSSTYLGNEKIQNNEP